MTNLDPVSQKIASYRTKTARPGSYTELTTGNTYLWVPSETDDNLLIARALKRGRRYQVEVFAEPVEASKKETTKPKVINTVMAKSIARVMNRARLAYAHHHAEQDAKSKAVPAPAPVIEEPAPMSTQVRKPRATKPRAKKPVVSAGEVGDVGAE